MNFQTYFARFTKEILKICLLRLTIECIPLFNEANRQKVVYFYKKKNKINKFLKFIENLRLVTTFSRLIPKGDLIFLQITNIFSELLNGNREKNDSINEIISAHLRHLKAYSIPKEYEALFSKNREVLKFFQMLKNVK